jgi:hypothetical protein
MVDTPPSEPTSAPEAPRAAPASIATTTPYRTSARVLEEARRQDHRALFAVAAILVVLLAFAVLSLPR